MTKKKKSRRFFKILFLIILAASAGAIYVNSRKFTEHIRVYLMARLSRETGYPVQIDRVTTDILNNIVVHGIRIYEPGTSAKKFEINKVQIRYSLWKAAGKITDLREIVNEIFIYGPSLTAEQTPDGIVVKGLEKLKISGGETDLLPPWRISIFNGAVLYLNPNREYDIKDIDARLMLAGHPEIAVNTTFSVKDFIPEVRAEGTLHILSSDINLALSTRRTELTELSRFLAEDSPFRFEHGTASANLIIETSIDKLKDDLSNVSISGDLVISDALAGGVLMKAARINVSPQRLLIEESILSWDGNPLTLTGTIRDYLRNPAFEFSISGSARAEEILYAAGLTNVKGVIEVDCTLEGRPEDITVSGSVFMESGTVSGLEVEKLETYALYRAGRAEIGSGSAQLEGGNLIWEGKWDIFGGDIDMALKGAGVALSNLDVPGGISGTLSCDVNISGRADSPVVEAAATVEDLRVPKRSFEHVTFRAVYADSKIDLRTFTLDGKHSASLTGSYSPGVLTIDKAEVSGVGGGTALITGKAGPGTGFDLQITGERVNIKDLPELLLLYPTATGSLDFSASAVSGDDEVRIIADIAGRGIRIESEEFDIAAAGEAVFRGRDITVAINEASAGKYLDGNAELNIFPDGFVVTKASVTVRDAPVRMLSILAGRNILFDGGIAAGTFQLDSEGGRGKVEISQLSSAEFLFGDLSAEISGRGAQWDIDRLQLVKSGGLLDVSGAIIPSQSLEYVFSGYSIEDRIISAEGAYVSQKNESGYWFSLTAGNLSVQNRQWPALAAEGSVSGGAAVLKVDAGGRMRGEARIELEQEKRIESEINFDKFELAAIIDAAGSESSDEGEVSGVLRIMGALDNPLFYLRGNLDKALISEVPVSGEFGIEAQGTDLKILDFSGTAAGGSFKLSGGIKERQIDISAVLKNYAAALIPWTRGIGLEGGVDADLSISGQVEAPSVSARLKSSGAFGIAGADFRSMESELSFHGNTLDFGSLILSLETGNIALTSLRFLLESEGTSFKASAQLNNLKPGPLAMLGRAGITGSVTYKPLRLRADVTPDSMLINRLAINKSFSADLMDNRLKLSFREGLSIAALFSGEGVVIESASMVQPGKTITGSGILAGWGAEGNLKGTGIEIGSLLRLLDLQVDYLGRSNFDISFRQDEDGLDAGVSINVSGGRLGGRDIGEASAEFTYAGEQFNITRASFYDQGSLDVTASGIIGADSDLSVSLNRLPFAFAEGFAQEINRASGYFKGHFNMRGSVDSPELSGSAELFGGRIIGSSMIDRITGIGCRLDAEGSRILISGLEADWKPGRITGSGYIDFAERPFGVNISLKTPGKGVSIKVPRLDIPQSTLFGRLLTLPSNGEPRFDLKISNNRAGIFFIRGDIFLHDTHFTYPPSRAIPSSESVFQPDLHIDINLIAGESVWYENTFARIKVDGSLNFRIPPSGQITVNGQVTSSQGTVSYLNREFSISQASLIFEDSVEYISASATTDMNRKIEGDWVEDVMELTIPQSRISEVRPVFQSGRFAERTSSREAMEVVIAGSGSRELTQEDRVHFMRREFLRAIDANLTSPLIKNILGRMDLVDVAKIDVKVSEDPGSDDFMLEGAGLRLGRYFSDRLYMGYYLEMGRDLRLSNELDLLYRLQGSQFLKGSIDEERRFFLGLEQRIRF